MGLNNQQNLTTNQVCNTVENVIKLDSLDATIYSIKTHYMFQFDNKLKDIVFHFDPQKILQIPIKTFIDTIARDIPKLSRKER